MISKSPSEGPPFIPAVPVRLHILTAFLTGSPRRKTLRENYASHIPRRISVFLTCLDRLMGRKRQKSLSRCHITPIFLPNFLASFLLPTASALVSTLDKLVLLSALFHSHGCFMHEKSYNFFSYRQGNAINLLFKTVILFWVYLVLAAVT